MINESSSLQKTIRLKSKYSQYYKNDESISTKKIIVILKKYFQF